MKNQKGQTVVPFALLLVGLAILVLVFMAAWEGSPAQKSMNELTASALGQIEAAGSFSSDTTLSHALKHGPDAVAAYKCMEKYPRPRRSLIDKNGDTANICEDGLNFFVQFNFSDGRESTAYKLGARDLGSALKYLTNKGFFPPQ